MQLLGDGVVVNHFHAAVAHQFQYIEQFACIAAAEPQESFRLFDHHALCPEDLVFLQRAVEQLQQILFLQGLQYVHLTAAQEGGDHLKTGVLGCGADQCYHAFFHCAQEAVLLRFAEPVYLVDEENRASLVCLCGKETAVDHCRAFGFVDHLSHLLHAACHRAQGIERPFQIVCDDLGKGGLAYTRRSPEDETRQGAALDHLSEHGAFAYQMALTDILVQCLGA